MRPPNGLKRGKVNVEQRQSGEDWLEWPPLGAKKTRRKEPGGWKVLFFLRISPSRQTTSGCFPRMVRDWPF